MMSLLVLLLCSATPSPQKTVLFHPEAREIVEYGFATPNGRLLPDTQAYGESSLSCPMMVIGTPEQSAFYHRVGQMLPFKFKGDTVSFGDTSFVANDYLFAARIKNPFDSSLDCQIFWGRRVDDLTVEEGQDPFFDAQTKYCFSLRRKCDGMYTDPPVKQSVIGSLEYQAGKLVVKEIKWFPHRKIGLNVLESQHIKLHWDEDLLSRQEAQGFVRLMEVIYRGYQEQYGLVLADTVRIYLRLNPDNGYLRLYDNTFDAIWCTTESREDFLNTQRRPISAWAHEFARMTFQPFVDESKRIPPAPVSNDWSHYAPMIGIVPYVKSVLGDSAWLVRYDYYKENGPPLFERVYKGGENTYAYRLYEIDKRYGKKKIGEAIKKAKNVNHVFFFHGKYWRNPDMVKFMEDLAASTGDQKVIERVRQSEITPFEQSLAWKPIGFVPNLTNMVWNHRFVIDSVRAGTPADTAGFKKSDEIVKIDGYDTYRQKSLCYRNLLFKNDGDEVAFVIKRNGSLLTKKIYVAQRSSKMRLTGRNWNSTCNIPPVPSSEGLRGAEV